MKVYDVGEGKVLLIRDKGNFHAIGTKCTHYGAPLVNGKTFISVHTVVNNKMDAGLYWQSFDQEDLITQGKTQVSQTHDSGDMIIHCSELASCNM